MAFLTTQHTTQLKALSDAAKDASTNPPNDFCSFYSTIIRRALVIAKDVAPFPFNTIASGLIGIGDVICPQPAGQPSAKLAGME